METKFNNHIKCLPVFQNQQDFLIGVFTIGTILKFTKYTKRLIVGYNDENVPEYNGHIQRELENSRVNKIADFLITDPNATFPTNIVLHIPSVIIESQQKNDGFIDLQLDSKVVEEVQKSKKQDDKGHVYITIIDGQHRIRGIERALETIDHEIDTLMISVRQTQNNDLNKRLNNYI